MSALEVWAQGRFKPMAEIAHLTALSAHACHELILLSRRDRFLATPEARSISAPEWIDLYRRPTRVRAAVVNAFQAPEKIDDPTAACLAWKVERRGLQVEMRERLEEWITKGITTEERLMALRELERSYCEKHLPRLRELISATDPTPPQCRNWFGVPEFNFFMTVATPCWLEYQTTPFDLYHRARCGDFDSLERLLRLDPQADQCRRIQDIRFEFRKQSPEQFALLERARFDGRKRSISPADVKYLLGACLMELSKQGQRILDGELHIEVLKRLTPQENHHKLLQWIKRIREAASRDRIKCRLKSTDIRSLFDAAFRDAGKGDIDPDFTGQPESILRRLNRKAKLWPSLQKPDKNCAA